MAIFKKLFVCLPEGTNQIMLIKHGNQSWLGKSHEIHQNTTGDAAASHAQIVWFSHKLYRFIRCLLDVLGMNLAIPGEPACWS